MRCCLRLFCWHALILALALLPGRMLAQTFTGEKIHYTSLRLQKGFTAWEVYRLDADAIHDAAKASIAEPSPITLQLSPHSWKVNLTPSRILADNYTLQVPTADGGRTITTPTEVKAFKGYEMIGGGSVRLTLDDEFIFGFVEENGERWYVEPLWYYDKTADRDLFVVYPRSAAIPDAEGTCGALEAEQELQHLYQQEQHQNQGSADFLACYEAQIAIGSDYLMFDEYGSVTAVENHNIGVLNDVQNNYIGSFNHDIMFVIVTQFVADSPANDPWTTSTNAGALLDDFRAWGQGGGFGTSFDVGELWTDRNFSGSTIGIAYLSGVCNSFKYHCLQDFTTNSEQLRVLTAHELGHNFGAGHDASGCPGSWIMCPSVNTSNSWSNASINSINNFIAPLVGNCLSSCGPPPPPLIADFDWTPNPACEDQPVQFNDLSSGIITSYSWMFTNGIPATSTQQNPTVTWANPGTYNAKLTLQGTGGPVSITKQVVVGPVPVANFTHSVSGTTVTFNSTSTNADTYSWDFGDGFFDDVEDPVHTYDVGGFYTVVLTVSNNCGTSTKTIIINTAPSADFSADPQSGCASLTVQFQNESSNNSTSYLWSFPGGSPSASGQTNPVVTYFTSGTYTVSLTAFNSAGSTTMTKTGYITVQNIPTANFNFSVNGLTVNFTNTSIGATSSFWEFGDGNTSTQTSPSHTYAAAGTYTVVLTSINDCGELTTSQVVLVVAPPVASFTASPTSGCGPLTVQFTNTSSGNPTSFNWQFPGGNPTSSTAENPSVTYNNPGQYTVTLVASNGAGSNTSTQTNYITVSQTPTMNAPDNQSACGGTPVSTTFTGTAGATFNWTNSNTAIGLAASGSGNLNFTSANVTSVQTATITVTPLLSGCNGAPVSFTIAVNPTPTVSDPANQTVCGGQAVNVSFAGNPSGATFGWTNSNTNIGLGASGSGNIAFSAANVSSTQTGNLTVTPTLAGCTGAAQNFSITVEQTPTMTAPSNQSACGGAPVAVAFNGTSGASFNWTNSNTAIGLAASGSGNLNFTGANVASTQTGTITVTPQLGNCDGAPVTFTVTINPTPTMTDPANQTVCGGASVAVDFAGTPGGASFSWTNSNTNIGLAAAGSGNIAFTAANVATTQTGNLTVTPALAGCAGPAQNFTITVDPLATAGFTSSVNGTTTSFTNTSTNATSYAWNFGDGNNSTQTNPTHTYATDGTYTVVLTATGPCGTATATQNVVIVTPPTAGFTANPTSGCGPLIVQFTSTSSANATNFNWQFPGGSPSSSTAQNPSVTYSAPGTYSVTLTVSNAAGDDTETQTNYITIDPVPTANFSASVAGATATFTNASSNATSYSWDFGDGNNSTQTNPSHTYANDGTYTVTLTATNPCGTNTFTQNVVVITSPNAGFTANTTSGCGPLSVQFTDLSSGNTTAWNWTFEGGTPATSTEENPLVVFDNPGTYDVTLVAFSAGGSSTFNQPDFITVLPDPTANFSAAVNGVSAAFTNNSQNANSYLWDFGDGATSSESNPTHTYTTDGVYTVVLIATNNCGTATFTQTVTIVTPPTAGITASASAGCAPLTVQFTNASSDNATTFEWMFEGGQPANSTDENPSATWSSPGTYTVTLIASNTAGSSTATTTITVNTVPTAGFTTQTAGLGVVLTNTSVGAVSYLWDFGDGSTSTETNPIHNYATTGIYTITLQATNACGTVTTTQTVEISGSAPLAMFSANPSEGCAPMTVQFTDASAGNPTSWSWTFAGGNPGTSNAQNPTATFGLPGTYAVTLVVTNAFGSNETTQTVTVNSLPTAGFVFQTANGTVTFGNQSLNATSYTWNFGDGNTSNEANPVHTYAASGTYTVELTAVNACGASTLQQTVTVVIVSSTGEAAWVEAFRLFPNPNGGAFTVELSGLPQDEIEFTLFNAVGQLVRRETAEFRTGNLVRNFDYGDLPGAVYSLGIRGGDRVFFVKIVVQR